MWDLESFLYKLKVSPSRLFALAKEDEYLNNKRNIYIYHTLLSSAIRQFLELLYNNKDASGDFQHFPGTF